MTRLLTLVVALLLMILPLQAFGEAITESELDAKTTEVAKTLRCIVCKNQSIAESDAALAKDMKALLRERLAAGDSEEEARDYMVERYGEFVLLKPRFSGKNLLLWVAPFLVLIVALIGGIIFIRSRRVPAEIPAALTAEEQAELDRLRGQ